jgi:voltage-gated potassium channel
MLILTIVMVPVLIMPYAVHHLSAGTKSLLDAIDYFIWAIFLFEYLIRVTLAPNRRHFVIHNIPDLVIVLVPMLRPLRIIRSVRVVRALRLSRLTALAGEGAQKSKRSLHSRVTNYVLVVMAGLIVVSSVVVLDLEREVKGANIKSLGDALWWAVTTITTVGYGDRYPVTAGGRAVAAVLMIGGIALLGVITAAIAAYFVQHSREHGPEADQGVDLIRRLDAIEAMLAQLVAQRGNDLAAPGVVGPRVE